MQSGSASVTTQTPTASTPVDWGRIIMVPFGAVLAGLAVLQLVTLTGRGRGPSAMVMAAIATGLTAAFYCLIMRAYLRRGPARATSQVRPAFAAGALATLLPFALPFVGQGGTSASLLLAGDGLLILGFSFSVWSLRCLDRSLSVVPQARVLVQIGPYSRIRHPLYLGELVAMLGLALSLGGVAPVAIWSLLVALQAYRAVQEESLLGSTLPGYDAYAARTSRILPGVF